VKVDEDRRAGTGFAPETQPGEADDEEDDKRDCAPD